MENTHYSYQDIFLKPRYSSYHSRSEIDTSVTLGNKTFKVPVMPANMACTISSELAKWMSENDYFYIMHRFNKNHDDAPNEDNRKFIETANKEKWKNISISLGVKHEDEELIYHCITNSLRIDYITIDIAHADSVRMKDMLIYLNRMYRSTMCNTPRPFIIAGNVATPEGVTALENWGADATKVGIAAGAACRTFNETGFGVPMFSCILACAAIAKKPIIADGGISECGHIAKALVAGGAMVMVGSMFARSIDSPAKTIIKAIRTNEGELISKNNGGVIVTEYADKYVEKTYKQYYGSASFYNKNSDSHVEGTLVELECDNITYKKKLEYIKGHLQSSISYAGGDIKTAAWGVKNNQKL